MKNGRDLQALVAMLHGTTVLAVACACITLLPTTSDAQASPLESWTIDATDMVSSIGAVELHRVRGAALDSAGRLVIADAGNSRIVTMRRNSMTRSWGRSGAGPAEFTGLDKVRLFGDTVAAYDAILHKTAWFSSSGTLLSARGVPQSSGRTLFVTDFVTAMEFVAVAIVPSNGARAPLRLDSADVLRVSPDRATSIARVPWRYGYVVRDATSSTTYSVSFLGQSAAIAVNGAVVIAPLDQSTVTILRASTSQPKSIALPSGLMGVGQSRVTAHRDSLLGLLGSDPSRYPGARERIEGAFGPSFRVPAPRSPVDGAMSCGRFAWLRILRTGEDAGERWWVLDVNLERFVAEVKVPAGLSLLSCAEGTVSALRRDLDDEESVVVRRIRR